jgi:hypothetical protein
MKDMTTLEFITMRIAECEAETRKRITRRSKLQPSALREITRQEWDRFYEQTDDLRRTHDYLLQASQRRLEP